MFMQLISLPSLAEESDRLGRSYKLETAYHWMRQNKIQVLFHIRFELRVNARICSYNWRQIWLPVDVNEAVHHHSEPRRSNVKIKRGFFMTSLKVNPKGLRDLLHRLKGARFFASA